MNRGFVYYFGKGLRLAAKAVLKSGKFLQYYVYYFMGLLGRMIPFFGAIFPVADVRRAKILEREGELTVVRPFGGVEKGSAFGTALLCIAIEMLILAGGLFVFAAVGYGLAYLGNSVGILVEMQDPEILAVIFAAPAAVAALVYTVLTLLFFAPTPYILDSNEKIGATSVLTACMETMRQGGKLTCLLNVLVPILIKAAYIGLSLLVLYLLNGITAGILGFIVCLVWILLALSGYIVFAPILTLACTIANTGLFADISLDPAALDNRTKGVFIKYSRTNRLEQSGLDSNLLNLFDNPPEPPVKPAASGYSVPSEPAPKMQEFAAPDPQPSVEPVSEVIPKIIPPVPEVASEAAPPSVEAVQQPAAGTVFESFVGGVGQADGMNAEVVFSEPYAPNTAYGKSIKTKVTPGQTYETKPAADAEVQTDTKSETHE